MVNGYLCYSTLLQLIYRLYHCIPPRAENGFSTNEGLNCECVVSGLNYIDSFDVSKSRCGCPARAGFYIFAGSTPDRSTN